MKILKIGLVLASIIVGLHSEEAGHHFVEEVGEENEIISIEDDHLEANPRRPSGLHSRAKRDRYMYTDDDTVEEEGSGGGDEFYDLDDDNYEYEDDNYDAAPPPVMPSRVVPTPISPSFDEPGGYGNVVTRPASPPTRTAFDVIKTSLYDEVEEGSGNEDYEGPSTIVPTRVTEMVAPKETRLPEYSPTFPMTTNRDRDPVIVTERLPIPTMNQAPYIRKKLQKYAVTAGRSLRFKIPVETFNDIEDGNTRNMKLDIKQENGAPLRVSWLKFDADEQAIYALPFDENGIGRYTFTVTATDKGGKSVADILEIVVRQYSGVRLINHQFTLEFSFTNWDVESTNGWEWRMLKTISQLYGDSNSDNILVRNVGANPYVFSWTNDSLTQQTCPKTEVRKLFSFLVEGEGNAYKSMYGSASQNLKTLLGDSIYTKSVSMSYQGTCLQDDYSNNLPKLPSGSEDSVPMIRNPIDRINVMAGELLRYKVPEDMCYDQEDGKTPQLNLHLLTTSRRELSPNAWLQFDGKNQEFVGIPLEEEVGREEYNLVCSDNNGLSAIDGIQVNVNNRPLNERFGVEFSLQFGPNDYGGGGIDGLGFGQPILRRDMKVRIVESLATYFGDYTTSNVILKTFDADNGRVVWHNISLAHQPCDSARMVWVKNQLISHEGKVAKRLVRHFQPYLRLVDADVVKQGHCVAGAVPAVPTDGSNADGIPKDTIFHGIIPSADYLLTFIIPAVIITCMLILAILLACMLHKKRKAGKLNLFYSEALPPRVPVILQDELFDEHDTNKQPVLLREDLMQPSSSNAGLAQQQRMMMMPPENEMLLHHQQRLDPYGRGSLGRPTPAYQRRQL